MTSVPITSTRQVKITSGTRAKGMPESTTWDTTADRVLNIVYLNPGKVTRGGSYPDGVNGSIRTSGPKQR